jgi:outer membrane protein OmpA-like peptidoglycan-associated protein
MVASTLMQFALPEEIKPKEVSKFVKGVVFDAKTQAKLDAKIDLIDLSTKKIASTVFSDAKNGDYLIVLNEGTEYGLYINKDGYLFKSLSFNAGSDQKGIEIDIPLEPIVKGQKVTLNNIFFASGSFELDPKSQTELDRLYNFMKNNAKMIIEISGHTDDIGSADANQQLSMNRAKSVYEYLEQKGIEKDRIRFEGYGESQPISPNDSDENRAKNRRIEFKIL